VELAQLVQLASEERRGEIDSATIHGLFMQHFVVDQAPVTLKGYQLDRSCGHDVIAAHVAEHGAAHQLHGAGEGALAAFVDAWMRHSGQRLNVVDYSEHALGSGTDAEAIAYVQINIDGRRVAGAALDHDTVSASLKAVLSALNRDRKSRTDIFMEDEQHA
jgi:2-isopropylmalate synthase